MDDRGRPNPSETNARLSTTADLATTADFRLGGLLCRPSLLSVTSASSTTTLEPRVMLVLVALAQHKGQVVSRERLIELCWNGRVVGDDAVQRCIALLRKVSENLGGFTLETIRRVGYRLVEIPIAANMATSNDRPRRSTPAGNCLSLHSRCC